MKNDLLDALKERLSSGVVGTFSLFFITVNWKIWVLLFSGMDAYFRIRAVTKYLESSEFLLRLLVVCAFTGLYLRYVPRFSRFLKVYEEEEQHKLEIARLERSIRLKAHRAAVLEELDSMKKYREELHAAFQVGTSIHQNLESFKYQNFHPGSGTFQGIEGIQKNLRNLTDTIGTAKDRIPKLDLFIHRTIRDLTDLNSKEDKLDF